LFCLVSSCNRKDATDGTSSVYADPVSAGRGQLVVYVYDATGIASGGCLVWSYKKHDPFGFGYCSQYATTDVARVFVKDWTSGELVPGATVTGNWSGAYVIAGASAKTNNQGVAFIKGLSGYTTQATFTITGITVQSGNYDASRNSVSVVTIR
jgi:hypothetical protein